MPVNRITCRAVQVMVDMMRDLMERVMDEAATCADSNGRVTIDSGNINAGARLQAPALAAVHSCTASALSHWVLDNASGSNGRVAVTYYSD